MINKNPDILMDKICRSCMCESENMKNVFEPKEVVEGQQLQLSEMLMACASVEVLYVVWYKKCSIKDVIIGFYWRWSSCFSMLYM